MAVETLFISYRRRDSAGWAGRLYADLRSRMPPGTKIFMDVDGIPPGSDFATYIDLSIKRCEALIVVIGPDWAGDDLKSGARRIDDDRDWVRLEVESALRRNVRVIPMKVENAELPSRELLPPGMRTLVDRQAIAVDNFSWDSALTRLVTSFQDPPQLVVSPLRLDFGQVPQNSPFPSRRIQISNAGDGDLAAQVTASHRWIRVRNNGDSIDVWVDSTIAGDLSGRIEVDSAGGTGRVAVTATVLALRSAPGPVHSSFQRAQRPTPAPMRQQLPNPVVAPAPTHLFLSLLAVVIGLGTGAIPLVYSLKVGDLNRRRDYAGARRASGTALVWGLVISCLAALMWLAALTVPYG